VAVNAVTNKIYVANVYSDNVTVIDEQVEQAIPLTVAITALPNGVTTSATPTFTFTATSTFTPTAPPVTNIYYQVDTWQGVWLRATPAGATGTGATLTLLAGTHILYAFAVDGGEATSINSGFQSSPLIGTITAYPFTYIPPFTLTYTLTYVAGANGSITGSLVQTVNYGASGTLVTAVPTTGYHFVDWTPGGLTTASRTDTNVTADHTFTANFAIDSVIALTAPAGGAKWGFGTSHQITYTCAGITTSVTIELSRDNGSTWANLTTSATGGTGSFSFPWTVTEPGTINARVRVSGNGQSSTSAIFDIAEEKGVSGTFTATFANGQVTVQGTGTGTLWVTPLERPLAQVPDLSPFLLGDTGKRGAFFWDISQQGLTGMLTITLHYPPTLGEETFQLFRWDGSDWVNQPGTLNVANHTFTFSIDASLLLGAPFALAGDPHAMPSMNPWAIVLLAGGLFAAGAWFLRRRLLKAN
jgi:hypothetical protein